MKTLTRSRDFPGGANLKISDSPSENLKSILVGVGLSNRDSDAKLKVSEVVNFLNSEFQSVERTIFEKSIDNVLISIFQRLIFIFPQKKDYVKWLKLRKMSFLKNNMTDGQISLLEELIELDSYQEEFRFIDRTREKAVRRMNRIEQLLGLSEEEETKLELIAQAHFDYLKGRKPLSERSPIGYQMTLYDRVKKPRGLVSFKRTKE